ncbi:MAG: nucleotidyltransferase [Chlorobi bacterium]|nr:nucleotidyltransferase [Chlorobiota bacterium]
MDPTLLILAAGLGSRYGGIKQMDQIGPSGESIIDYSVYDAIRAGFGKVVFVLNPNIIDDFRSIYEARLKGRITTEYILQEISDIPSGISFNPGRIKPWGTAHAVLVAKNYIQEPFAVINADDFYGKEAYSVMASYLKALSLDDTDYSMVGYRLKNTLSENGTVSRGICTSDNQFLVDIVERTRIYSENGNILFEENDVKNIISGESVVSMNFWGFTPRLFVQMENDFRNFIEKNSTNLKAEFYIPFVVNKLINAKKAGIKVLTSEASWFGVTYKEDKDSTIEKVAMLIDKGIYPAKLW